MRCKQEHSMDYTAALRLTIAHMLEADGLTMDLPKLVMVSKSIMGAVKSFSYLVEVPRMTSPEQLAFCAKYLPGMLRMDTHCDDMADALARLTNLTSLTLGTLGADAAKTASSLTRLTNLRYLCLSDTFRSPDAAPETIEAIMTAVGSLSNLRHMGVRYCCMMGCQISAMRHLSGLSAMTSLDAAWGFLSPYPVAGMQALGQCVPGLVELDASNNGAEAAVPHLTAFTNLTYLGFRGHRLSSGCFVGLTALKSLDLREVWVEGDALMGLSCLKSLTWLNLSRARVADEALRYALPCLTGLKGLDLSGVSRGLDVQCVASLTGLTWLNLSRNELIRSVSALGALTILHELDLSRNDLACPVSALTSLTDLTCLYLHHNWLTMGHVMALTSLVGLKRLTLGGNWTDAEEFREVFGQILVD
jgi:Leucine-rich repeat (LRR) protein